MSESEKVTLTVRLIRSLEYATIKSIVMHDLDPNITTQDLENLLKSKIETTPGLKPYKTCPLDTIKIYTKAHGFKPNNLTINLDNDDTWILHKDKTLKEQGIEDETELSYFNMAEYTKYKQNPELKWI